MTEPVSSASAYRRVDALTGDLAEAVAERDHYHRERNTWKQEAFNAVEFDIDLCLLEPWPHDRAADLIVRWQMERDR